MRADIVVIMLAYEEFRNDYERAYLYLNDPSKK